MTVVLLIVLDSLSMVNVSIHAVDTEHGQCTYYSNSVGRVTESSRAMG
jgi:hypothetical protein